MSIYSILIKLFKYYGNGIISKPTVSIRNTLITFFDTVVSSHSANLTSIAFANDRRRVIFTEDGAATTEGNSFSASRLGPSSSMLNHAGSGRLCAGEARQFSAQFFVGHVGIRCLSYLPMELNVPVMLESGTPI